MANGIRSLDQYSLEELELMLLARDQETTLVYCEVTSERNAELSQQQSEGGVA